MYKKTKMKMLMVLSKKDEKKIRFLDFLGLIEGKFTYANGNVSIPISYVIFKSKISINLLKIFFIVMDDDWNYKEYKYGNKN